MNTITQLSVGGIFAILVLKIVFEFVSKAKAKRCNNNDKYANILQRIQAECIQVNELATKLYDMHNKTDEGGVYVWYVRRSLEDAIIKLSDNIDRQTIILGTLVTRLEIFTDSKKAAG